METLTLLPYPTIEPKKETAEPFSINNYQTPLENALNSLFPDQSEENKVLRTRKHLGEVGKDLSDVQVETIISEFQFLIDTWLDEYETEVFNGQTLKEVLNGG